MTNLTELQRHLLFRAALLFFVGMLTGLWAGVVLSDGRAIGMVLNWKLQFPRLVLASHLNALMGTFWLLGVAFTLEHGSFTDNGKRWLARLTLTAAYGNWAITLLASILDARGLDMAGDARNNIVAGLLQVFVVVPTLAASGMWVLGLRARA
jgi:hypothetical protein